MKIELSENLTLTIEPETQSEQALVRLLEKKRAIMNGCSIHNAGMNMP